MPCSKFKINFISIAGYFEDDASDELTNDPVFKSVLEKDALASQPTLSRFFNRMDEDTLNQLLMIGRILRKRVYRIQMPQAVILDLDSSRCTHTTVQPAGNLPHSQCVGSADQKP